MTSRFVSSLTKTCQLSPQNIALPELRDPRVLSAALQLCESRCVNKVYTLMNEADFNRSNTAQIPQAFKANFVWNEMLKVSELGDETPLVQAGRLLQRGIVDSVLAGAVHTTADVIRAAISTVGIKAGMKTISGAFLMNREEQNRDSRTFLYADCGVVIEPTLSQLRDIATASVETWRKLQPSGEEARLAFLSFSTKGSAKHPSVDLMREAASAFQKEFPDIICDGEIQFDAAIDAETANKKCPNSPLKGRANIFIFPNLNAGNIAYKITQRLGNFSAYGPILQGTGKVFSDLSRGATTEDIFISALINNVRAKSLT